MTTQPAIPTKAELLDALRDSGQQALDKLRALPESDFEQGRYENGWNGRQILAHIASIEWSYPRLLEIAKEAPQPAPAAPAPTTTEVRRTEPSEAPNLPTRPMQGGVDSYNDRQVAKRADASVAELLDEFERNRAATIAAVEGADEALLTRPIRSSGGITGALAGVINSVAVLHVLAHVGHITGAET
ncbi:MAG: DinB family protein [Dehalococcoidia bacterium]